MTPRAQSVTADGSPDGFEPQAGFFTQVLPGGITRLLVSAPTDQLLGVHRALLGALEAPLSVLYRQKVDRRAPRPQGAPERDYVGVDLGVDAVRAALERCSRLAYGDARAEIWVRGLRGAQVVLDGDGLLYCYPDDPAFRDVVADLLPEREVETLLDRDYVKHWFQAEADAEEDDFITTLGLTELKR